MNLFVIALAALVCSTAHGSWRVRRALRRSDVRLEPATLPPHRLTGVHHVMLRSRADLRCAMGLPVGPIVDLRPGGDPAAPADWSDPVAAGLARARLARLWRRHRDLLGTPGDPVWHLHGRTDRMRLGPLGVQVVTLRATLGHDPGRWIGIRAVRRSRGGLAAVVGFGGGGRRFHARRRALDPSHLIELIGRDLSVGAGRPWPTDRQPLASLVAQRSRPRRHPATTCAPQRGRWWAAWDRLARARWEVVAVEVIGSGGPSPTGASTATSPVPLGAPGVAVLNHSLQHPDVGGQTC